MSSAMHTAAAGVSANVHAGLEDKQAFDEDSARHNFGEGADTPDELHGFMERVVAATDAAQAAATGLGAADSYGARLQHWLDALSTLGDGERPGKPPQPDVRKLGEQLRQRRTAAWEAALELRGLLHEPWRVKKDALDKQQRAEYDAGRDWSRAPRKHAADMRSIKELTAEWRRQDAAKKAKLERAREERRLADESMLERHAAVRAPCVHAMCGSPCVHAMCACELCVCGLRRRKGPPLEGSRYR